MSLVVVRCPECRGVSHADEGALGLTVGCPRCEAAFLAAEEAEVVAPPGGPRLPGAPPPPEPPRPFAFPEAEHAYDEDEDDDEDDAPEPESVGDPGRDHEHDPGRTGGLPASVLIGLALLPFAIPILWAIAPAVLGQAPTLSLAVPVALAVSASVLCLAVIYTIDWSPPTRIKGVLLLVGLAYLTAGGLYFLRKDMVDQVRKFFGGEPDWAEFKAPPDKGGFQVKMPPKPGAVPGRPPVPGVQMTCYRSGHEELGTTFTFVAGSGRVPAANGNGPAPGTPDWFDVLGTEIVAESGGKLIGPKPRDLTHQGVPGRELEIELPTGAVRVVRVFYAKDRLYYLAAEGPDLDPGHELAQEFFDSLVIPGAAAAKD